MKKILITGACGFIGSNFVKRIAENNKEVSFLIIDALTYAGNYSNIQEYVQKSTDHNTINFTPKSFNSLIMN